tara:strand:- start:1019 stop:1207 length:189 start_codon:yes stop_codon:yes gene_type:complete
MAKDLKQYKVTLKKKLGNRAKGQKYGPVDREVYEHLFTSKHIDDEYNILTTAKNESGDKKSE